MTCESTKIAWLFSLDDLFGPLLIIFSPAFLVELYPLFLHFPTMLQSFFHHFALMFHHFPPFFQHFPAFSSSKNGPPSLRWCAPGMCATCRIKCIPWEPSGSQWISRCPVGAQWGERVQTWD